MGHKILCFLREADFLVQGGRAMPVTCEIDVSNNCQNNCNFCIYASYIKSQRVDLDWDLFVKIVYDLNQMGVNSITFTGGGEPLWHEHIRDMILCASDLGIELGLVTNGVYLSSIIHLLDRFQFIRISLDCASPQTYRRIKKTGYFDIVVANIKDAVKERKTDIGISMVIVEENKDEIDAFYELGKSLGVDYVQVKPAWKPVNIEDTTKDIKDDNLFLTERYTVDPTSMIACKIAGLVGQVGANGKMYYCCVHRGKDAFEIGDLRKDSIYDLLIGREDFTPDLTVCGSCRYMNYAKVYQEVNHKKFTPLRHRAFL